MDVDDDAWVVTKVEHQDGGDNSCSHHLLLPAQEDEALVGRGEENALLRTDIVHILVVVYAGNLMAAAVDEAYGHL